MSELKSFLPSETGKERLHPPFPTPLLPPRPEEAFLHCCCCGVIFIQTLGRRAGFFSLSCPLSPVLFLHYPLANGPCWCCRFGAGCLTNSVHRWEISGTTWQIRRTLLEAAGVIQIFIHLLCMEYKEDESTDTWSLRSVWKNHILSLFPIGELLFPPEKLNYILQLMFNDDNNKLLHKISLGAQQHPSTTILTSNVSFLCGISNDADFDVLSWCFAVLVIPLSSFLSYIYIYPIREV